MALNTTTSVTVSVQGVDAAGNNVSNTTTLASFSNTVPTAQMTLPYPLVLGFNTINIPLATTSPPYRKATIMPAAGSGVSLILKGVTGDTGYTLDPTSWTIIGLPAGGTQTIGITAGAATTIQIAWG